MLSAGGRQAHAQTHTITINNNCGETIWIGAFPKVQAVTVNGASQSTLGGWEMASGASATVTVPANYNSGRFWARTGCGFNASNACPAAGAGNNPPANCCDTGGCTDSGGNFVLDCDNTGIPPTTLAEITTVSGGMDSYDVSMVDGGSVSVEIIPDSSTYQCDASNGNCVFSGNLPGKNSPTCSQDSDCYQLFGFGYKWKCDPSLNMCVNPFFCGSPGCSDTNGCAPVGLTQSLLPPSAWDSGSDFAVSESDCPSTMQITDTQNQGSTYVGCIAPQKFCRKACSSDGECGPPFTQDCGASGFCEKNGTILGSDCETAVGNTTNGDLWACTGVNSGSCFTTGVSNSNCCGCPSWAPGFVSGASNGACVAGNNPNWVSAAEPRAAVFNSASPTSYAFPYDDAIKLFGCEAKPGSVTAYTVNFCCLNSDGDGVCNTGDTDKDNDCVTDSRETFNETADTQVRGVLMELNDIDGDGVENLFDLDSDNDGIPDIIEAGGQALDQNANGEVDDETDVDEDGLADVGDPSQGAEELLPPDTDGDGIPDMLDTDSDNDGSSDYVESGGADDADGDGMPDDTTDTNRDGLIDAYDPDLGGSALTALDTDGDGVADRLDASNGGGGCSLAASDSDTKSSLLLILIPALIILRRVRGSTRDRV